MTALKSAGFLLTLCWGFATPTLAQEPAAPPVLTVCEALRNFDGYKGKDVVIVGGYEFTFEGAFMSEKCETDDRILIQGHRWLSMIALGPSDKKTETQEVFPVDEAILREKLGQVNGYRATVQGIYPPEIHGGRVVILRLEGWYAVYGRLDSPGRLKPHVPPSASHSRNTPGNGYGANVTVPVKILVINQKSLD